MIVMYSRYLSSEDRADGDRSKSRPVAAGDQKLSFDPMSLEPAAPCTISIAIKRGAALARLLIEHKAEVNAADQVTRA